MKIPRICSISDCGRQTYRAQVWCQRHYYRNLNHGDPLGKAPPRPRKAPAPCAVAGCEAVARAKGMCNPHYHRQTRYGDPLASGHRRGTCSLGGCDKPHYGKGLCQMHWHRQHRRGDTGPAGYIRPPYDPVCSVDGCPNPHDAKGLCVAHYKRKKRHNSTECPPRKYFYGPDHHLWVDEPSYLVAHRRMADIRGRANRYDCIGCGGTARQWSYDHTDPDEKVSDRGYVYSLDMWRYIPLCHQCHTDFDHERRVRKWRATRADSKGEDAA